MTRLKSTPQKATEGGRVAQKQARKTNKKATKTVTTKEAPAAGGRRHKPGVVALRELRHQIKSFDVAIQKAPFSRLVREIADKFIHVKNAKNGAHRRARFEADAMELLQQVIEQRLVSTLADSYKLTAHRAKDMLTAADIAQREELRNPPNHNVAKDIREELCEAQKMMIKCQERSLKAKERAERGEGEEEKEPQQGEAVSA